MQHIINGSHSDAELWWLKTAFHWINDGLKSLFQESNSRKNGEAAFTAALISAKTPASIHKKMYHGSPLWRPCIDI